MATWLFSYLHLVTKVPKLSIKIYKEAKYPQNYAAPIEPESLMYIKRVATNIYRENVQISHVHLQNVICSLFIYIFGT